MLTSDRDAAADALWCVLYSRGNMLKKSGHQALLQTVKKVLAKNDLLTAKTRKKKLQSMQGDRRPAADPMGCVYHWFITGLSPIESSRRPASCTEVCCTAVCAEEALWGLLKFIKSIDQGGG